MPLPAALARLREAEQQGENAMLGARELAAGLASCAKQLPAHVAGRRTSVWGWPQGAEEGRAWSCMQPGAAAAGCWLSGRNRDVPQAWLAAQLLPADGVRWCPGQHCSSSVASLSARGQACVLPVQRRPSSVAVTQLSRASSGGGSNLNRASSGEARVALGRQLSTPA